MKRALQLNRSALSPLAIFTAAWVFAALLSQYRLLDSWQGWSWVMIAVVVAVPIAFLAGGLIGQGVVLRRTGRAAERQSTHAPDRLFRRMLIVLLLIGLAELAHQFAKIGGVPLLSAEGGSLRFSQGGPTIVLTNALTIAAIAALTKPRDLLSRESRFELLVAGIALTGFALQAGRGSVVLPVIVAIAARWLYWGRPAASILVPGALLAFAAVVFGFYLRTRQHPYNPFEAELYGEILPQVPFFLQPLVPIYLAITTNFVALQGVVGHFPTGEAFGNGAFDAIGFDIVFSWARNLSDVSATLSAPWVTSTMAGSFWADGGFLALVPGIALTGFLSAGAFAMAVQTRSLRWSMAAAYLLYLAVFGLYTNLWTQQVDWLLAVPLLVAFGAILEDPRSPPGLTGRLWGRIRRMTGRVGLEAPVERPAAAGAAGPDGGAAPPGGDRAVARKLILLGIGVVALLFVSGLAIQRLLREPYPLVDSVRLPAKVGSSPEVMTNSDRPSDNEPLVWVRGQGHTVDLQAYFPSRSRGQTERLARIGIPQDPSRSSFDIGFWPPWRAQALFSFEQRPTNVSVAVSPTWEPDGEPQSFVSPISEPPPGISREFMIAAWGGKKPDMFAISRGDPESRPVLQILSGESGFRRQLYATRLPWRGVDEETWSLDIAPIVGMPAKHDERVFRGNRLDLVLVEHDPGEEHSQVHVLLGETGFQWDAVRRALDNSGSVPPGTDFLTGSSKGATAIYEVQPREEPGPRLQIFGLTNPPAIQ